MKEIVAYILNEEEAARKRVQDAGVEAEKILSEAKKRVVEITEKAVAAEREKSASRKSEIEKKLSGDKNREVVGAKNEAAGLREKKSSRIPDLAHSIFTEITDCT
ncbi:MAG: hypothetical protein PHE58_07220 [Candidatus Omnitrophica bacterium]|nr:hypothetical protein [Candidatus Omnitrophota bacterium]